MHKRSAEAIQRNHQKLKAKLLARKLKFAQEQLVLKEVSTHLRELVATNPQEVETHLRTTGRYRGSGNTPSRIHGGNQ